MTLALVLLGAAGGPALAETLFGALSATYLRSPELNAARAELAAIGEGVPQAEAAFRPTVTATLQGSSSADSNSSVEQGDELLAGISFEQPIFQGFRAANGLRQAEIGVLAAREALRDREQDVLLEAVTAYADVMRDRTLRGLNGQNLALIGEQVSAARRQQEAGEATVTEIAEAEVRMRAAEGDLAVAGAALAASEANYVRVIGGAPDSLAAPAPLDALIPPGVDAALAIALAEHPALAAARLAADIASLAVDIAEGALLPTASITGSVASTYRPGDTSRWGNSASITGTITIPLYSGGRTSSEIREARDRLSQRQIETDREAALVEARLVGAFAAWQGSGASLAAAEAQVSAAQAVVQGIEAELEEGQRTLPDLLDAQQQLLGARAALVDAQRNRVVSSYEVMAAMGRLSAATLGLPTGP